MTKHKKAAMEMSVGTIVTIVLLMTVLVLGLVLVRTIFKVGVQSVEGVDKAVRNEIDKLFAEDDNRKIILYPKEVTLKKGDINKGFGIFIRNTGETAKFKYDINAHETSCDIRLSEANNLIVLNKKRNLNIPGGNIMEDDIVVKFHIPETMAPCQITYVVSVEREGQLYTEVDSYVTIEGK